MNLELRLRRNAVLAAVLGMLALGLAEMNPLWMLIIVGVSVLAWVLERREASLRIGATGLNLIILAAAGFAGVDYFFISQSWIVSLAHFLLLVQSTKLLLPKVDRDIGQIYLISLMNVAVAAIEAADILFAAALVLYSGVVLRGLILYHFRRELAGAQNVYLPGADETARPTTKPEMRTVISRRFLATLTAVVIVAWAFNALFFTFVPRLPNQLFRVGPLGWFSKMTGFSDSVRLGDIGRVLENTATVMHVELYGSDGNKLRGERDLYFRGITYQHYDGRGWERVGPDLEKPGALSDATLMLPYLRPDDTERPDVITQDIRLEPIGTSTIFALQGVVRLGGHEASRAQARRDIIDATFAIEAPPPGPLRYYAWSVDSGDRLYPADILARGRRPGRKPELPAGVRKAYLQVPDDVPRRVRDLALSIAPVDAALSDARRARDIEEHLKKACTYTLDLRPNPDAEPVDDFLFNTKKGHCEYFASSMVVLLRCAGIPARLVTGFHGGEWNGVGEWYLVKQSDAHAWVEAFLPDEGWVRFDPTPAQEREQQTRSEAMGPIGRWLDYLRSTWMNNVVQYDQDQQNAVLSRAREASRRVRGGFSKAMAAAGAFFHKGLSVLTDLKRLSTTEGALIFGGTILASTLLVLTARWLILKLVRRLRREFERARAKHFGRVHVGFYQDLLRLLRKRGFTRADAQTPLEFAAAVAGALPDDAAVREITEAYYRVRFGGIALTDDEEKRLRALVDSLRTAARPRSG